MHTTATRARTARTAPPPALIAASQSLADLFESGDIVIDVLPHHDDESLAAVVAVVDAFLSAVKEVTQ